MSTYTPTIGLEIHAELKTKTKMFCGCLNAPHALEPNLHVCPVCLAHPGTLPVINGEAVKHVLRVGLAVEGALATFTEFDRKNYFYPDIPKGYQISQYKYPLVSGGTLAGVALTRIHLEEDTARSLHDQSEGSIIDYNRAGVPLMELVTEPVIHDAETAVHFAKELQLLLRTLDVSDANMEMGEMRVEANISVSGNDTLGTKVEVKNLNSFKSVEQTIIYEVERQAARLEKGEEIVQETRGFDEKRCRTFSQRSKETAEDYRYFPDPDLPKMHIPSYVSLSRLKQEMPELPNKKRLKYNNLGLPREQIEIIISDKDTNMFFEEVLRAGDERDADYAQMTANYLTSDVQGLIVEHGYGIEKADPKCFMELIMLVVNGEVNSRVAKDLLAEALFEHKSPKEMAEKRGLFQQNSKETLLPVVEDIIREHAAAVDEYKAGKESALQFLVGQGMKATKGAANPTLLQELLQESLK